MSKDGPGGSLNAFLFLLMGVISQRLARVRKRGGARLLGYRSTMESCMLHSEKMNLSLKGIYNINRPFYFSCFFSFSL